MATVADVDRLVQAWHLIGATKRDPMDSAQRVADALRETYCKAIEDAAKHVENHCCLSTCCDAQPGGGDAAELAQCVRKLAE